MWNLDPGGLEPSKDLPLLANTADVRVRHYLLDLGVNFSQKTFAGSVILFLEPATEAEKKDGVKISQFIPDLMKKEVLDKKKSNAVPEASKAEFGRGRRSRRRTSEVGVPPPGVFTPSKKIKLDPQLKVKEESFSKGIVKNGHEALESVDSGRWFQCILDCCDIEVESVEEVILPGSIDKSHVPKALEMKAEINSKKDNPKKGGTPQNADYSESSISRSQDKNLSAFAKDADSLNDATVQNSELKDAANKSGTACSVCTSGALDSHRLELCNTCGRKNQVENCVNHLNESSTESLLCKLLQYDRQNFQERNDRFQRCRTLEGKPLHFGLTKWSLCVWKDGVESVGSFPQVIRIRYRTKPQGQSLTWIYDQVGKDCVFTQGAWINNRSLFPCQEPPGAMATWQAHIGAPSGHVVLMSGDEAAKVTKVKEGLESHYYHVDMVMPPSMLALAIGKWQCITVPSTSTSMDRTALDLEKAPTRTITCDHEPWPCRINTVNEPVIPSRLFGPKYHIHAFQEEFADCIPLFFAAAHEILGPHPFKRMDFVILPKGFAALGLASPSLTFLSQTTLPGDQSFCPRIAHEISHAWFGLLIGALDWTEEWLSEGFATFLEDPIQALASKWSKEEYTQRSNLRALLRYRALNAEIKNTASELQIMRPMGDKTASADAVQVGFVKNGLNPDKWYLQVHYLKGYFLLRFLADLVGLPALLSAFREFVNKYHGKLVLSKDFFDLVFQMCPALQKQGISKDHINKSWLDCPGMPPALNEEQFMEGNKLVDEAKEEAEKWELLNKEYKRREKGNSKKKKIFCEETCVWRKLISEQLCLVLELLLEEQRSLTPKLLNKLRDQYDLSRSNAEVKHRWCEIVIKHRFMDGYGEIRMFLLKDQSMGVYLYGELIASEDPVQRVLAQVCYNAVEHEMDRGSYKTVKEMFANAVPLETEETTPDSE